MTNRSIRAKITFPRPPTNYRNACLMIIRPYFDKTGQNMAKNALKLAKIWPKWAKNGRFWAILAPKPKMAGGDQESSNSDFSAFLGVLGDSSMN